MFDTSLYTYVCFKHFGMANIKQILHLFLKMEVEELSQTLLRTNKNFVP